MFHYRLPETMDLVNGAAFTVGSEWIVGDLYKGTPAEDDTAFSG